MRFDNPMLGGLKRRRFTRPDGTGRVESRLNGVGGVLRDPSSATLHAHQHIAKHRHFAAPILRRSIQHYSFLPPQRERDRIETRVIHEQGPVRELLRLDARVVRESAPEQRLLRIETGPSAGAPGNDATTVRTRSLRELTESTVERIIRRRQRTESVRDTRVVMRERQNVSADLERAVRTAIARPVEAVPIAHGASSNQPGPLPFANQLDLDRLTDQIVSRIDDRLIAHRERMGGVY
jgi:hypothetical protein